MAHVNSIAKAFYAMLRDWFWFVLVIVGAGVALEYLHNDLYPIPSVMAKQMWLHKEAIATGIMVSSWHVFVGLAAAYLIGYPLGMMVPLFEKAEGTLSKLIYAIFGISRFGWVLIISTIVPDKTLPITDFFTLTRADLFSALLGVLYSLEMGRNAADAIVRRDPRSGQQNPLLSEFLALGFRRRRHMFWLLLWPMTRHSRIGTMIVISNFLWMSMIYVESRLDPLGHGLGQLTSEALDTYAAFGLFYGCLVVTALCYLATTSVLRFIQNWKGPDKPPRRT